MADDTLIWPSKLHHLCLTTGQRSKMIEWYRDTMGLKPEDTDDGMTWMKGSQRNLLLQDGESGEAAFIGIAVANTAHLERLRIHVEAENIPIHPLTSPMFRDSSFAITDPDGHRVLFGLPKNSLGSLDPKPGCLQHVVFATTNLERIVSFYTDKLGCKISDIVREEDTGDQTACFLRTDEMHHTLAFFRAPAIKLDHFAHEATCWNDIRDWGDHFASHHVEIVWGAGRHGAGNNLFIFVRDPDENNVEISAELETLTFDQEPRYWPHNNRALNLWGHAWLRS